MQKELKEIARIGLGVGFLVILFAGCVPLPVLKTSLASVAGKPLVYKNQRVEFSGRVIRNVIKGEKYVTWSLTLGSNDKKVFCQEKGWNVGVIRQAWDLAEQAKEKRELIVVTGIVRVNHLEMVQGLRLDLETIEYQNRKISTDFDDYPPWHYERPLFWPSPYFPYYRYRYRPWYPHYWWRY